MTVPHPTVRVAPGQRGMSMMFALLAVAALALASIALVRSVDSSSIVIGNLGFKQEATAYSELGSEAAIAYLSGSLGGATLDANAPGSGYYATARMELDPTNHFPSRTTRAVVDWDGDGCAGYASGSFAGGCLTPRRAVLDATTGKAAHYVITRMCSQQLAATDTANVCAGPQTTSTAASPTRGDVHYSTGRFTAPVQQPYFRIIVRTTGTRGTASVTETIVHF